ncbi:hypothetical protein ANME2D_02024 [Candidatus Methanoperedens nitroreducens]|uniref:Uncharacterized protein n=1 Tax=Candidatus Methanoperedens nitratireducens TaxID=1392998 RepID=A0A062V3R6_9EURY|nr:hypothetical protein ANME2D_02024 [Candidatus Methanoperedens nitroreducens]
MNYLLILLWAISMIPLLLLPYSIALFYQRSFKRRTYPSLFLISLVLYIVSSIQYLYSSFIVGNLFFALGGVLLGGASFRLHRVMTGRWK